MRDGPGRGRSAVTFPERSRRSVGAMSEAGRLADRTTGSAEAETGARRAVRSPRPRRDCRGAGTVSAR
jgi:hypothetical protein